MVARLTRTLFFPISNIYIFRYIIIEHDTFKAHTATFEKNLNPVFNQTFIIPYSPNHPLNFKVMDKDFLKDDEIGKVHINLETATPDPNGHWVPIKVEPQSVYEIHDEHNKHAGDLHIALFLAYSSSPSSIV